MGDLLLGLAVGCSATWIAMTLSRETYWHKFDARRRDSNPPAPGRKPAPPAGPPEQPLAAQLIRYWLWEQEQVRRAWLDPAIGEPWPEDRETAPPAGPPKQPTRFDEGPTQRGNGSGGATTPKPPIKPQPTGPRMVGDSIKPPPIKPQFPPPRKIREDFL